MPTAPTGTVTFLFTDIEGSTKLAQQYPDTLPAASSSSIYLSDALDAASEITEAAA